MAGGIHQLGFRISRVKVPELSMVSEEGILLLSCQGFGDQGLDFMVQDLGFEGLSWCLVLMF